MKIESAKDLRVYQKSYALAMELFEISKEFPNEERYALTDQIKNGSVLANTHVALSSLVKAQ